MYFLALILILSANKCQSSGENPSERIRHLDVVSQTNADGTVNMTYDCSVSGEKVYASAIWSSTFPDNLYSLSIINCKCLILNITFEAGGGKQNFTCLTIRNVENCTIIASELETEAETGVEENQTQADHGRTALPRETHLIDIRFLSSDVPLLRDHSTGKAFTDGVLHFSNVTVKKFVRKVVHLVKSRLKRFTLRRVTVTDAEEDAIAFHGACPSVLEIDNSSLRSVPGNFINCNVTRVNLQKNQFGSLSRGCFSLRTRNFEFSGNIVGEVNSHAFNITAVNASLLNNSFHLLKSDSFRAISIHGSPFGKGSFRLTDNKVEKVEEGALNLNGKYFADRSQVFVVKNRNALSPFESMDNRENNQLGGDQEPTKEGSREGKLAEGIREKGKGHEESVTSVLHKFGDNVLLLWFFAVSAMILLFPIAYFVKICFSRALDQALPLQIMHRRLHNVDDDT